MFSKKFTCGSHLVLAAMMLFTINLHAQQFTYSDSWGEAGLRIEQQSRSGVTLNFSINDFSIVEEEINGRQLQNILLPGVFLPNDEGMPNLPGVSRFIAIPNGSKAMLKVTNYRTETIKDVSIAPAPRIPFETEDGLYYEENQAVYSKNAHYPAEPFLLSEVTNIRGVEAVMVGLTPYQYNPVTKELIVYRDVKIEVTFEGGDGQFGDERLRSRWFDPIHQDVFLNSAMLPEIDYNQRRNEVMAGRGTGCEYLIVTPNNAVYQQWADSIKQFRTNQGILTKIVTLAEIGGSTANQLKSYFTTAYNTWDIPPVAVLLLADFGTNTANNIISPIYNNYCASDNIFADMTNNHMPDMIFARITANNATQLQVMVSKFINYERNPPTNPGFYNHPITALGWQTERWFQICSETVGGFWRNQGKNPVRVNDIYSGTPGSVWSTATNTGTVVNYFGPNGVGYIPATPAELGGWSGGTATMVNNAINSGAFMLQHRDHGYVGGWGEPSYSNNSINALYNTDLTFVFSINCLTGKYNISQECFAEKFHRHTSGGNNAGALGVIAASEISYSFVNDAFVWGMFDNMYPEFLPDYGMPVEERGLLPAYANASGKYFLQQSAWPYNVNNKVVTYHLFHHHGGAFLNVYSEVPQPLSIAHEDLLISGEQVFTVTADAGSFIALTVDGEIIGTAEGTGQPVNIEILPQTPPATLLVTVTKQNFFRYESQVEIIAPDGPYVVLESFEIDDSMGNGNGLMDYGETIYINMTLKNVGVDMTENLIATVSSQDDHITMINPTAHFGEIPPDESVTLEMAFELEVCATIPNQHEVLFELSSNDGAEAWSSTFKITAHAPVLHLSAITISDPDGNNNGRLDPGEQADILVTVANTGDADVIDFAAALQASTPFIMVNSMPPAFGELLQGEEITAAFNVTTSPAAPAGVPVELDFDLAGEVYHYSDQFNLKIGQIVEDFESGDFSAFDWEFGGSLPWSISPTGTYQGQFCAVSGPITHNQISTMEVTMEVATQDEISFFYKVFSEQYGDFLHFYIDNSLKSSWTGVIPWTQATFEVAPGVRTFKWIYHKNHSVSFGNDCAWVDNIEFPAPVHDELVAWPGFDVFICEDEIMTMNAYAANYETLLWETSGDGTFDDNAILNPVYMPGDSDRIAGMVLLTLTASDGEQSVSSEMTLSFLPIPQQAESLQGETELCVGTQVSLYSTIGATHAEDYHWSLSPVFAGLLSFEGKEASIEWSEGWTGFAELSVVGVNGCGEGEPATLNIAVTNHPGIPQLPVGEQNVCAGEQLTYQTEGGFYDISFVWEIIPEEAGEVLTHGAEAEVIWNSSFHGEAALHVKSVNPCGESDFSEALMLNVAPMPVAAAAIEGREKVCFGITESYSVADIAHALDVEWIIEPAEAGTITHDGTICQVTFTDNWEGTATLRVRGVNDCGHGDWSEAFEMLIEDCTGIHDMASPELSIYPNPSDGAFTISLNAAGAVSIRLTDARGTVVYSQNDIAANGFLTKLIQTTGLAQGVYYLTITGERMNITEKVIIYN